MKCALHQFGRNFGLVSHICAWNLCFLIQDWFYIYQGCRWASMFKIWCRMELETWNIWENSTFVFLQLSMWWTSRSCFLAKSCQFWGSHGTDGVKITSGVTRTLCDILTSTLQRLSAACTYAEFSLTLPHRACAQRHTNVSRVRSSYSCRAGTVHARQHRATGLQATGLGSIPHFFRASGRVQL